jgi:hypothetical protein
VTNARYRLSPILRCLAFLGLLGSAIPGGAGAQAQPSAPLRKASIEIAVLGGTALPVSLFRARSDRRLTMVSVDIGRVMTNPIGGGPLAGQFELLLEVSPLIVVRQPESTFGVAVSPLFMRWNFMPVGRRPLRAFVEASGGIVYTGQPVPVRTTVFNFIDQAGGGLRFETRANRVWLVGYRFQHISNAGRVRPNPGANFNFVYGGVSFPR